MRVVLDTNTLVSAMLSPNGPPRRLVDAARDNVFELCSSPVLMAELLDVLSREKFANRFKAADITPLAIVKDIRRMAYMVSPTSVPRVIVNDEDDDHVLACAVASHADLIVSGDKDLHTLGGRYHGIPIVRPAQAMALVGVVLPGKY
jgi:uncharacterized protein